MVRFFTIVGTRVANCRTGLPKRISSLRGVLSNAVNVRNIITSVLKNVRDEKANDIYQQHKKNIMH
jgi:hypothetical protein